MSVDQSADSLASWWRQLGSAALVGTARRPVPDLPPIGFAPRPGARPEELALDAAALGSVLRRAGQRPTAGVLPPDEAPQDARPEAPRRAVQLLELLLTQPPGGAEQAGRQITHWVRACDAAGCRVPHRLLPTLLERATDDDLRPALVTVIDARGRWLAAQNPDWGWALQTTLESGGDLHLDPDDWARLASPDRLATLAAIRRDDPAAGRELLLTRWARDAPMDRRTHLETHPWGRGADAVDFLAAALDDRAGSVRDFAADLLEGLPSSRRAQRMADRLRPLIRETGLLRKAIEVGLPDEPDAAGVRDGLGKPPPGRSKRGWWLQRIVAGAPFETWGHDAAHVVVRLDDEDALAGLRRAATRRRTPDWARALLDRTYQTPLLLALPRTERADWVLQRMPHTKALVEVAAMIGSVPAPWTPIFSAAVIQRLIDDKAMPLWLGQLMPVLVDGLHPDALPALQRWRDRTTLPSHLDRDLGRLIQSHSIQRTISEAFQ